MSPHLFRNFRIIRHEGILESPFNANRDVPVPMVVYVLPKDDFGLCHVIVDSAFYHGDGSSTVLFVWLEDAYNRARPRLGRADEQVKLLPPMP